MLFWPQPFVVVYLIVHPSGQEVIFSGLCWCWAADSFFTEARKTKLNNALLFFCVRKWPAFPQIFLSSSHFHPSASLDFLLFLLIFSSNHFQLWWCPRFCVQCKTAGQLPSKSDLFVFVFLLFAISPLSSTTANWDEPKYHRAKRGVAHSAFCYLTRLRRRCRRSFDWTPTQRLFWCLCLPWSGLAWSHIIISSSSRSTLVRLWLAIV